MGEGWGGGNSRWLLATVLTLALWFSVVTAWADVAIPPLRSPVTDLTGTLTQEQVKALEQTLLAFEKRKGSQIAILVLPTTKPEAIEQFSIRLAEAWRVGRKSIDDGAIIVLALQDREVRIEVGYGLEGALPDLIASRIIRQDMVPHLRSGEVYLALTAAVDRIVRVIDGEPLPEPAQEPSPSGGGGLGNVFPILLMVVLVGGSVLRRMFGSFLGAGATGGLAGVIAFVVTHALGIAIAAGVIAFIFSLLGGGGGGGLTRGRRGGWGGGMGGWSGGGSSWGGGGGGWSGGGGGFGGGGASGRW
ncbi:MAG: TPM domain-containing protein [Steroidobacteraceae bacterium]